MKAWSRTVLVAGLVACSDSTAPTPVQLLTGRFVLERVDGIPLPVQITFPEPAGPCALERSTIDFGADTIFVWMGFCADPLIPPDNFGGFGWSGRFAQVTADSIYFPALPAPPGGVRMPPVAFGKQQGDSLVVRTDVVPQDIVGPHVWLFRRVPAP